MVKTKMVKLFKIHSNHFLVNGVKKVTNRPKTSKFTSEAYMKANIFLVNHVINVLPHYKTSNLTLKVCMREKIREKTQM